MYFLSFLLLLLLLSFCLSPRAKAIEQKKGFLLLMANSHKFVLNMSSIDWPCQMNTIKETALSASHLGGEDGGIKRKEEWKNGGRKTRWESGREGWNERIDGQKDFWQQRSFFGRVAACPHVAINVYVCVWTVRACVAVCILVIHLLSSCFSSFLIPLPDSPCPLLLLSVSSANHQEEKRQ